MIVGKSNYARYGQLVGLGNALVVQPDFAADPDTAASILVAELTRVSRQLKSPIGPDDVRTAQRLITGSSANADALVRAFEQAKPLASMLISAGAASMRKSAK